MEDNTWHPDNSGALPGLGEERYGDNWHREHLGYVPRGTIGGDYGPYDIPNIRYWSPPERKKIDGSAEYDSWHFGDSRA